jgi:hypothetical protein
VEKDHPRGQPENSGPKGQEDAAYEADEVDPISDWKHHLRGHTLEALLACAQRDQELLNRTVRELSGRFHTKVFEATPKTLESAKRKLETKHLAFPGQITDLARASFEVTKPEEVDRVVRELEGNFSVFDEGWKRTPVGYFDRKVLVRFRDGGIGEIQFVERNMATAKEKGHTLYERWRGMKPGTPGRAELGRQMLEIYHSALENADPSFKEKIP